MTADRADGGGSRWGIARWRRPAASTAGCLPSGEAEDLVPKANYPMAATTGAFNGLSPIEPLKLALPKEKIPPSDATSQ